MYRYISYCCPCIVASDSSHYTPLLLETVSVSEVWNSFLFFFFAFFCKMAWKCLIFKGGKKVNQQFRPRKNIYDESISWQFWSAWILRVVIQWRCRKPEETSISSASSLCAPVWWQLCYWLVQESVEEKTWCLDPPWFNYIVFWDSQTQAVVFLSVLQWNKNRNPGTEVL